MYLLLWHCLSHIPLLRLCLIDVMEEVIWDDILFHYTGYLPMHMIVKQEFSDLIQPRRHRQ